MTVDSSRDRADARTVVDAAATGRPDGLLLVLIFLSIWSPADDIGYPEILETVRYLAYPVVAGLFLLRQTTVRSPFHRSIATMPALWLSLLVAYWCLSAIWSDELVFSVQRSVLLTMTALAAASAVASLSIRTVSLTLFWVLLVFVVCGAATALLFPSIGVEASYQHAGKWRGLASQKNTFGMIAAVTAVFLLSDRNNLPRIVWRPTIRAGLIGLCLFCLYMSESRGATVDFAVGVGTLGLLRLSNSHQRYVLAALAMVAPVLVFLVLSAVSIDEGVISTLGVDFDTSNRVGLWTYAFNEWVGKEILGVGFGGFWTVQRIDEFRSAYGWVLPNFHNGYIAIIVETGILGAVIFSGFVASILLRVVTRFRMIVASSTQFYLAMVFLILAHNAFENSLSRSTNILLVIFMIAVLVVASHTSTVERKTTSENSGGGSVRGVQR